MGQAGTPAYLINRDRLDALMKKHGVKNMPSLAEATGISVRVLYSVLEGKREPRQTTVRKMLALFPGVSHEYLFEENPAWRPEMAQAS
jgi:DNA-binding phage protein